MKRTGKILIAVMLVVTCVACMLCFTACHDEKAGYCTIVVGSATPVEYKIDVSKASTLMEGLEYAKTTYGLTYAYSGEGATAFLTSVGDLNPDAAKGVYIYLYTTVTKDYDVSEYACTTVYKDTTLTNSGVGMYAMTLEDGAIIYIGTIQW